MVNQPIDWVATSFSLTRVWENLGGRVRGPLTFRFILQPAVARILAICAGVKDAREGRPAYFWAIFTHPDRRWNLLQEGWNSIAGVFVIALILDVLYQVMVHRWVYPGETLLIAILLAAVTYLLVRGPANQIARRVCRDRAAGIGRIGKD